MIDVFQHVGDQLRRRLQRLQLLELSGDRLGAFPFLLGAFDGVLKLLIDKLGKLAEGDLSAICFEQQFGHLLDDQLRRDLDDLKHLDEVLFVDFPVGDFSGQHAALLDLLGPTCFEYSINAYLFSLLG